IIGADGIENIEGGDGNDQLTANGTEKLYGGAGNDLLFGSSTQATRLAGDLKFFQNADEFNTFSGQDLGNDTILGGPFDDTIDAGAGSDLIRPGLTQPTQSDPNAADK